MSKGIPMSSSAEHAPAKERGPERLSVFPAFFRVSGRRVVICGNGDEAFAKARLLANTEADIVAVTDAPEQDYAEWLAARGIEPVNIDLSSDMMVLAVLKQAVLTFAATGNPQDDQRIVALSRALKVPANAVDQPEHCDFLTPALVNRARWRSPSVRKVRVRFWRR